MKDRRGQVRNGDPPGEQNPRPIRACTVSTNGSGSIPTLGSSEMVTSVNEKPGPVSRLKCAFPISPRRAMPLHRVLIRNETRPRQRRSRDDYYSETSGEIKRGTTPGHPAPGGESAHSQPGYRYRRECRVVDVHVADFALCRSQIASLRGEERREVGRWGGPGPGGRAAPGAG